MEPLAGGRGNQKEVAVSEGGESPPARSARNDKEPSKLDTGEVGRKSISGWEFNNKSSKNSAPRSCSSNTTGDSGTFTGDSGMLKGEESVASSSSVAMVMAWTSDFRV